MDRNEKIFKTALAKLNVAIKSNFDDVGDCTITEDEKVAVMAFGIDDIVQVTCTCKKDNGIAIIRGEAAPSGLSDGDLDELGGEIIEKLNARKTSYDGTLTIMKAISIDKLDETSAVKLVFVEVMTFVQTLCAFKGRLCGKPVDEGQSVGYGGNSIIQSGEENPFGFDDIEVDLSETFDAQPLNEAPEPDENLQLETELSEDEPQDAGQSPVSPQTYVEESTDSETANQETPQTAAAGREPGASKLQKETPAANQPLPKTSLLAQMLNELEEEDNGNSHVSLSDLDLAELTADVVPEDGDVLRSYDNYQGEDKLGIVAKTREYKDAARVSLQHFHDMLAETYSSVYQLSLVLDERNEQMDVDQREMDKAMENFQAQQKRFDEDQARLIEQQQALLKDRAELSAYTESVRATLQDYEVKCQTVQEQAEQIQSLKAELTQAREAATQTSRRLEALLADTPENTPNREYVSILQNTVKVLNEQSMQMSKTIAKYKEAAKLFRDSQAEWAARESDYQQKISGMEEKIQNLENTIRSLKCEPGVSGASKGEIENARRQIETLKAALAKQKELASRQKTEMEKARKTYGSELDSISNENKRLQGEVEKLTASLQEAEMKLAHEPDVVENAKTLKDLFANLGITLDPIPSANEMTLGAKYKDCQIAIDVNNSVVYIVKPLKKVTKFYVRKVDELNHSDIRVVYILSDRDVSCRIYYARVEDVSARVNTILNNVMTVFE